jgi:hypothetical protein
VRDGVASNLDFRRKLRREQTDTERKRKRSSVRTKAYGWKLIASLFIVWSLTRVVEAEPRWVNLLQELREAKIVAPVAIVSYDKDRLICAVKGKSKIELALKYSIDPTWNPSRFIKNDLISVNTADWPPVGSEVVVVADKSDIVSLFAIRQKNVWRFWSPMMTGSTAQFSCEPPSRPIKSDNGNPPNGSWNGCLLPYKDLERWNRW